MIFRTLATTCLAWTLCGCAPLSETQRAMLADGVTAYQKQDYARSADRMTAFLNEANERPEAAQAAYVRGMCQIKLGRRDAAYADLRRATEAPADKESVWRAYVQLSTLCFEDNRYDAALRMAVAAVGRMPNQSPRDAMLFRQGVCYERLKRWEESRRPFQQVVDEYPSSIYGQAGRRRLALQPRHFAIQVGSFAEARNAEALRARLSRNGISTYLRTDTTGTTPKTVVLVGKFAAYDEALAQLNAVRAHAPEAVMWP